MGEEREEERSVTHAHRPTREEERIGRNTWYSYFDRISLCIRSERKAKCGFWPDPTGNPDDLARSGLKPTHTARGFDRSDTLSCRLDPAVPSKFRRPCESMNPKRKDPFDPKQIKKSLNSKASGLSSADWGSEGLGFTFAMWGSEGLYAFFAW
jgi:hypothetical protein